MTQIEAGSQRILVVDDERFFREAIQDVLVAGGHECIMARDGAEALELAPDASIGVVVLDIELPGLDGIEVLKRLRESRPELRVVILSGHTKQDTVLEALRLGAVDYLAKPIHPEELLLSVRRALETYRIHAGWSRLRGRLGTLQLNLLGLADCARRSEEADRRSTLLEGVASAASEILSAGRTSVLLLDEEAGNLRVEAAVGHKVPLHELTPVAVGEGVAGQVFAAGEAILVNGVSEDERFRGRSPNQRYLSDSFVVAPMGLGPIGVVCATDRSGGGYFDDEDAALLRILGQQAGQLLTNEPAPEEPPVPAASLASKDAELARSICEVVASEVEPALVLRGVLLPVAEILAAAPVSLYLLESNGGRDREAELDGGLCSDREVLPAGRGLTGAVLATGVLVASGTPANDPRFDPEVDTAEGGAAASLLCVPLRFRGKTLGVFRAFGEPGGDPDPRTGEVLAAALSAAIRNVLLYRSLVDSIEEVARVRRQSQVRTSST